MNIKTLPNGNLEMTADVNEREDIKDLLRTSSSPLQAEAFFIDDFLFDPMGDGKIYEQVAPESCNALTDATLITDGKDVWGDMQYMVQSFLETLANGGTVTWTKG